MEVKFEVVKPNLYVVKDRVCFGIDNADIIRASRVVDETIGKHIGVLKVRKGDLETMESGKGMGVERRYDIPLEKYLDALERRMKYSPDRMIKITNSEAQLFDLSYVIDAQTIENAHDMHNWETVLRDLANPNDAFDRYEKENLIFRFDREKTLEEMRKLQKDLEPKIPDNYAELVVTNGVGRQNLGVIDFKQLKAKDKTNIEKAKAELVGRLKEIGGPYLSFDASDLFVQMMSLYIDAPELIRRYGDVMSPMWRTRLFKLDP